MKLKRKTNKFFNAQVKELSQKAYTVSGRKVTYHVMGITRRWLCRTHRIANSLRNAKIRGAL